MTRVRIGGEGGRGGHWRRGTKKLAAGYARLERKGEWVKSPDGGGGGKEEVLMYRARDAGVWEFP